jgi:hypothetical protein
LATLSTLHDKIAGNDQTFATHTFGEIVFRADGVLFHGDRAFLEHQAIDDYAFPGGIANRGDGFCRMLRITSTNDQREYCFRYEDKKWVRWVQAVNAPKQTIRSWFARDLAHRGPIGALSKWIWGAYWVAFLVGFNPYLWIIGGALYAVVSFFMGW